MTRRFISSRLAPVFLAFTSVALFASSARADDAPAYSAGESSQSAPAGGSSSNEPFRLERLLPADVAQNTDINAWGWLSYLHDSNDDEGSYWTGDVGVGVTQRFGDHLAGTVTMHYVDDNNEQHGFLEQAFLTAAVSDKTQTLVTFGKFNASFGIEPRDEWDRLTGTTSLLFGAQPQDLVGAMITQPIGNTGLKFKPFVALNFNGYTHFYGPPSGGAILEYAPSDAFRISFTNWIGPGVAADDDDDDVSAKPRKLRAEPVDDEYSYSAVEYAVDNWGGPELGGSPSGLLYFADLNVRWNPTPDWTLDAEGLFASTGRAANESAWAGFMVLANYDITDRWRVFGRWSYLNDNQGLVTGVDEVHQELSVGAGFRIIDGFELRGEYRHDFAGSGDLDSVSAHLIFSF